MDNSLTIVLNTREVPPKIKNRTTICSSNLTSEFIPNNWNQDLKESLVHVNCNTICNIKYIEITKVSISE